MRVIAGSAKGRKLLSPNGQETRPTADNVKEAVMSIIHFEVEGAKVLDLFSGTGQLGVEALSRGASSCVFVDMDSEAIKIIKQNLQLTKFGDRSKVVQSEAFAFIKAQSEKFDIVFLDPPYSKGIITEILPVVVQKIANNGIIICESDSADILPEDLSGCIKSKDYKYGRRKVNIFRKQSVL